MADLANNIRLAVDSGKVALGVNKVMDSVKENKAKLIVVAAKNRADILQDIHHASKISNVKTVTFEGDSMELGAVCGKPYSVSVLSVIEEGHSKILEESM
jgi:large subunit ribosomal protein L30e